MQLNHTHDVNATSWLESANAAGCDFPVQNLPFSVFRRTGSNEAFRGGVAIGDQVIDLAALDRAACLEGLAAKAASQCAQPVLNDFLAMGPAAWALAFRMASSKIATARVQPAEAPRIFTGKQAIMKPSAGSASRLLSFSRWQ